MIDKKDIYAQYFDSSKAVLFDQQAIKEKLKKSEIPVILPEVSKMCVVCRGPIKQLLFECSKCSALYHLKCAKSLDVKKEGCFQCHTEFPPLPELSPEAVQEDPIIISVRKLKYQTSSLLNPEDITHKDLSAQFAHLKKNLKDELKHKTSPQFYDTFKNKIDSLFTKILNLSGKNLDNLEEIKREQMEVFVSINKNLEELQDTHDQKRWLNSITKKKRIFCHNCGNEPSEEDQEICEKCGVNL